MGQLWFVQRLPKIKWTQSDYLLYQLNLWDEIDYILMIMIFGFWILMVRLSWILLIRGAQPQLHWFLVRTKYAASVFNRMTLVVLVSLILISAFTHSSMEMVVELQVIMLKICSTWTPFPPITTILGIIVLQPPLFLGELFILLITMSGLLVFKFSRHN